MPAGSAGLTMYMWYEAATPAKASQKGAVCRPCSAIPTGPWKISASFAMAGCLAASTKITSLKKSPKSMGWMNMKPTTTERIERRDEHTCEHGKVRKTGCGQSAEVHGLNDAVLGVEAREQRCTDQRQRTQQ